MILRRLSITVNALFVPLLVLTSLLNSKGYAAISSTAHFKAVAFDYFVIFDPTLWSPK